MEKTLTLALLSAAMLFAACTKEPDTTSTTDGNNPNTPATIAEQILGKWMLAEQNGQPVFTNEKVVFTFISESLAYESTSRANYTETDDKWANHLQCNVSIFGDTFILTAHPNKRVTLIDSLFIDEITPTSIHATHKHITRIDDTDTDLSDNDVRWDKVPTDYQQAILGLWEGHIASGNSGYDDGELHRWQYNNDGTFIYWRLDGDQWVDDVNDMAEYLVDGSLLCTRWTNIDDPTEKREWWEIASISTDGIMNWKALRPGENNTLDTVTFRMTRVQ